MDISGRPPPVFGVRSPKHQAKLDAQRDAQRQGEARQADAQQVEDASPAAEVQRFVQSTDEMSAALTQFRNRRDYDKKLGHLADSFERVLDEEAQPKAQQIVNVAKSHGISAEELLRQARSLFPDDSDLVLVLRELLRRRQLDEVVRKRLQALLKQVEDQAEAKPLKAGINCALKARLFGKALSLSPGLLRASYRQFLESEAAEAEIYADWVGSYGYQRRAVVLDFIEGALLADIDSLDASCSRLEFGNLLGRLSQLKLLRSADALFVGRMLSNPQVCAFNPSEADWLLFLLSLLQQPQQLDGLLAETVGDTALLSRHSEHSTLLQALYQACKAPPPQLFVDERWLDALQEEFRRLAAIAYRHELAERRREAEGGGAE
ncbi:YopN/LcrE/InvE/MxiC type III secretion system gatekeeper [Chromobacterium haemolyticum]|uniref:YopN/LcrE/InvE/MxiC type III secretion system gatekeeper n=1 Tax=Chromobacterium haemolyticum TaxID=394935 RepID=UPI000AB03DF3|nr:YopN/LcrE/InvE/MxiC type III secretion system gatekeeper [Chromobacterium haemolyticum]